MRQREIDGLRRMMQIRSSNGSSSDLFDNQGFVAPGASHVCVCMCVRAHVHVIVFLMQLLKWRLAGCPSRLATTQGNMGGTKW